MLVHFAHPVRGKSLCGAEGDIRWIRSSWAKRDVCPSCWSLRPRILNTIRAMSHGESRRVRREDRIVKQKEKARKNQTRSVSVPAKQLSLWGLGGKS